MTAPLQDPVLLAALTALHDTYERALLHNDTDTLVRLFWDSPHTIRYGINEHLYGSAAIAAFRQSAPLNITARELLRRTITLFNPTTASVMCEIRQSIAGLSRISRQSQLWIKFPDVGWKITAAHVSAPIPPINDPWIPYTEQTSRALGLVLSPDHLPGVAQQLARTAQIAAPFLAHPLPESTERAAIFTP